MVIFTPKLKYGKKTLIMLGKLVLTKHPEIAEDLLPFAQAPDTGDLKEIPNHFIHFCLQKNTTAKKMKGKLYSRDLVKQRSVFIASMLYIYNQNIYYLPETLPIIKNGFVNAISDCTGVDKATISGQIRKALFEMNTYEEFKNEVEQMIKYLKLKSAGC